MKNCNNSLTITCSSWNKKNTKKKVSTGTLLISVWICWPVSIWLKRYNYTRTQNKNAYIYTHTSHIYVYKRCDDWSWFSCVLKKCFVEPAASICCDQNILPSVANRQLSYIYNTYTTILISHHFNIIVMIKHKTCLEQSCSLLFEKIDV